METSDLLSTRAYDLATVLHRDAAFSIASTVSLQLDQTARRHFI